MFLTCSARAMRVRCACDARAMRVRAHRARAGLGNGGDAVRERVARVAVRKNARAKGVARALVAIDVDYHGASNDGARGVGQRHLPLSEHDLAGRAAVAARAQVAHVTDVAHVRVRVAMFLRVVALDLIGGAVGARVLGRADRLEVGGERRQVGRHARVAVLVDMEAVQAWAQPLHVVLDGHVAERIVEVLKGKRRCKTDTVGTASRSANLE
eukprot:5744988-Pleurochrysis_carterae.AAC.1